MTQIEEQFPDVTLFALDTPLWNVRTNRFTGNSRIQSMSGTTNSLTIVELFSDHYDTLKAIEKIENKIDNLKRQIDMLSE